MSKRAWITCLLVLLVAGLGLPSAADADALEDALAAEWEGLWAVVEIPFSSGCGGYYTDNEVRGRAAVGKGGRRFEVGELVTVYKVKKRWGGIDLLLDVSEPLLVPYQDGPFSLFNEESCKVQLEFDLSRDLRSRGKSDEITRYLNDFVETFASRSAAQATSIWNGRVRDPYPAGYEQTLAEYTVWKAHQTNAAVQEALDEAIEVASRMVDRFDDDPEYVAGFVEGLDRGRDLSLGDCEHMATTQIWSYVKSPPSGESKDWKDGFEEGQKLAIGTELARRLGGCFVSVPPPA